MKAASGEDDLTLQGGFSPASLRLRKIEKAWLNCLFPFCLYLRLMFERPALGTGAELLCEHVELEFAIYLCLLCLYLMPCFCISKSSTIGRFEVFIGSETSVQQAGAHGMTPFAGTMDRVGWTVRSRDICNTIQPFINVALIAE